jgi:hypothetical protein
MIEHVARSEERGATEDELAAAFAEVGATHGLSPHVYSERCEIARIMARGRHPAYQRHRGGGCWRGGKTHRALLGSPVDAVVRA